MSRPRADAVDPRVHAVRTLAAMLVRYAPRTREPEPPPAAADVPDAANQVAPERRAA